MEPTMPANPAALKGKTIAILATDGFEQSELIVVVTVRRHDQEFPVGGPDRLTGLKSQTAVLVVSTRDLPRAATLGRHDTSMGTQSTGCPPTRLRSATTLNTAPAVATVVPAFSSSAWTR